MVRKRFLRTAVALGIIMSAATVQAGNVVAEDNTVVIFDRDSELTYAGDAECGANGWAIGSRFEGMKAGDVRTETIELRNDNESDAIFYISQDALEAIDELNEGADGAYEMSIMLGDEELSAVIDNAVMANEEASNIKELKNYVDMVGLAKGESIELNIIFEVYNDNNSYADALDELGFNFKVSYKDIESGKQKVAGSATVIENAVIPLAATTQKDADSMWIFYIGILGVGAIMITALVFKRRKDFN